MTTYMNKISAYLQQRYRNNSLLIDIICTQPETTRSRANQALQQKSLDVLLIRGLTDGSTIQWTRNVTEDSMSSSTRPQ